MRLIFSSYQINLSLKNSSFVHISSMSFSFIMFLTVQYMIFMFVSKSSETLHFDEHNIIEFLERFKKQGDEYKIIEEKWWIKLFRYCIKFIAEFMKIFSLYVNWSWKIFEKKDAKKIQRSEHRADNQFSSLFEKIQE